MIGAYLLAAAGRFGIGILVGATSIGGFLLVPLLMVTLGLSISKAVAITLLCFVPAGVVGTCLYLRRLHVGVAVGLSFIALPGIWGGLWFSERLSERSAELMLSFLLALLAAYAGLRSAREKDAGAVSAAATAPVHEAPGLQGRRGGEFPAWRTSRGRWAMGLASLLAGACASHAGVGAALILVPLLVSLEMAPATAVGTGMLYSTVMSVFASVGKAAQSPVDSRIVGGVFALYTAGLFVGEAGVRRLDARALRFLIVALCLLSSVVVAL